MNNPSEMRLVIGDRWHADTALLLDDDASRLLSDGFTLDLLCAPIDVVVGTHNLTSFLPDERVVPFVTRLSEAVAALASASARKAIVELEESPWELALERLGDSVALSLYEVVAPTRVAVERLRVPVGALLDAVREAVERMSAQARTLPSRPEVERLLGTLHACRRKLLVAPTPAESESSVRPVPTRLAVETSSSAGPSLVTEVWPAGHSIVDYRGTPELDRHALLVPGAVTLLVPNCAGVRLEGRPLALLEQLVDGIAELVAAEDMDAESVLMRTEGRALRARALARRIELRSVGSGSASAWSWAGAEVDLLPHLLDHVRDVVSMCAQLNEHLRDNAHLNELIATSEALRRRVVARAGVGRDANPLTPAGHGIVRPRARMSAGVPATAETMGFPVGAIRRLRYEHVWTLSRPDLNPESVVALPGRRWAVRSARGVELVDADSGDVVLRLGGAETDVVAADGFAVVGDGRSVRCLEPTAGNCVWRFDDELRPVHIASDGERWLLVGRGGGAAGVDARTGRLSWRMAALNQPRQAAASGDLWVLAGDGSVTGVDPATGRVLWEHPAATGRHWLHAAGGTVASVTASSRSSRVTVRLLNAADGRERVRRDLPGVVQVVDAAGDHLAVSVRAADGVRTLVLDVRTQRGIVDRRDPEAGSRSGVACALDENWMLLVVGGRVIARHLRGEDAPVWSSSVRELLGETGRAVNSAHVAAGVAAFVGDEEIALLELATGRLLHRTPAVWEQLGALKLGPDGHVVALERSERRGTRLHGLVPVGFIAALDGGRVAG